MELCKFNFKYFQSTLADKMSQSRHHAIHMTRKGTETTVPRFDKQLEEFYSICDQIELNLQAAIGCASQVSSSQRHIPSQVSVRQEAVMNQDIISYPNYVGVAKTQVSYVKDVIDTLNDAAQNLSND